MTVAELIEILKTRPQGATAYVWDGDDARFSEVELVSHPAASDGEPGSTLPKGGVVIWGS